MTKKYTTLFLTVLSIIGFSWGFYQCAQVEKAADIIETDAARAFYELMNATDELSVLTAKAAVAGDTDNRADLYAQISRKADIAQENLSMLPVYNSTLSKTEHFLNQIGDYSASRVAKAARAEDPDGEEAQTIRTLNRNVTHIANALHRLEESDKSAFSYKAIRTAVKRIGDSDYKNAGNAATSLADITDTVAKTPSLIYDGPYSDHLENKGQIAIEGAAVDWNTAKAKARAIFGDDKTYVAYGKSSKAAGMAVYTVAIKKQQSDTAYAYLDISVNGGYVVQYTSANRDGKQVIDAEKALKKAAAFLKKAGYDGLKVGYHITANNILTANFTAVIDDIIVYPDMIKVSVDLANGRVVGMDAKNYLRSHRQRTLPSPLLTEAAAKAHLPAGITPVAAHRAIIPKADDSEVLCYEFRCRENDTDYLIYINAESGKEEDVLIVKDDESGTFTM